MVRTPYRAIPVTFRCRKLPDDTIFEGSETFNLDARASATVGGESFDFQAQVRLRTTATA